MAARFPSTMESAAIMASTGAQPVVKCIQAALPSVPAKPTTNSWKKIKKLATLELEAMKAALGAGAPWYTSGAQKWNGKAATLKPRPITVVTMATTRSGFSPEPAAVEAWIALAICGRLVEFDRP